VSRGDDDDDDDRAICRDTVNLRLTGDGDGDARPDRAASGSDAAVDASDSSANDGDRGAVLSSRSPNTTGLTSTWWISGGGVRLNTPVNQNDN